MASVVYDKILAASSMPLRKPHDLTISGYKMAESTGESLVLTPPEHSSQNISQPSEWGFTFILVLSVMMTAFILLAVVGNLLVIVVIIRNKGMRTRTNMFLFNLAVVDCITGVFVMPPAMITVISKKWILTDIVCQINGFLVAVCFVTSIHTLMYIALQKYLTITRPFKYTLTKRRTVSMICFAWIWGFFIAYLNIHGLAKIKHNPHTSQCGPNYPNSTRGYLNVAIFNTTCYFIPLSVMAFCYVRIFQEIKAASIRMIHHTNLELDIVIRQQKRILMTLLSIMLVFIICLTPFFVYSIIIAVLGAQAANPQGVNPVIYWFGYMNSALNPLVYAWRSPAFRQGYRDAVCMRKKSDDDTTPGTPGRFQTMRANLWEWMFHKVTGSIPPLPEYPGKPLDESVTDLADQLLHPPQRSNSSCSLPDDIICFEKLASDIFPDIEIHYCPKTSRREICRLNLALYYPMVAYQDTSEGSVWKWSSQKRSRKRKRDHRPERSDDYDRPKCQGESYSTSIIPNLPRIEISVADENDERTSCTPRESVVKFSGSDEICPSSNSEDYYDNEAAMHKQRSKKRSRALGKLLRKIKDPRRSKGLKRPWRSQESLSYKERNNFKKAENPEISPDGTSDCSHLLTVERANYGRSTSYNTLLPPEPGTKSADTMRSRGDSVEKISNASFLRRALSLRVNFGRKSSPTLGRPPGDHNEFLHRSLSDKSSKTLVRLPSVERLDCPPKPKLPRQSSKKKGAPPASKRRCSSVSMRTFLNESRRKFTDVDKTMLRRSKSDPAIQLEKLFELFECRKNFTRPRKFSFVKPKSPKSWRRNPKRWQMISSPESSVIL